MKIKFVGDKPNKTTKRYIKAKDAEGNSVVRVQEKPDNSPDANNEDHTYFFGVECPIGEFVEFPRDHPFYDLAVTKAKNNHHFEVVDDTSGSKKQSPKAA